MLGIRYLVLRLHFVHTRTQNGANHRSDVVAWLIVRSAGAGERGLLTHLRADHGFRARRAQLLGASRRDWVGSPNTTISNSMVIGLKLLRHHYGLRIRSHRVPSKWDSSPYGAISKSVLTPPAYMSWRNTPTLRAVHNKWGGFVRSTRLAAAFTSMPNTIDARH